MGWYLQCTSFNFPFFDDDDHDHDIDDDADADAYHDHDHDDNVDDHDDIIILGGWVGICSGAHSSFPF